MPWLLFDEKVLSSIATTRHQHPLDKTTYDESMIERTELVMSVKFVHTFGRVEPMDAIFLDEDFKILKIKTLGSSQIKFSPLKSKALIKTNRGNACRWNIDVGDSLEVRS